MREIKFRQWNPDSKYWHYFEFTDGMCSGVFNATLSRYPIMQYTGLKDKNGVEIYEGDIVSFTKNQGAYCNGNMSENRVVVFDENSASFEFYYPDTMKKQDCGFTFCMGNCDIYVVIGNIHENPELIEND